MTQFYKTIAILMGVAFVILAIYLRYKMNYSAWEGTMIVITPTALLGILAVWGVAWIMHRIDDLERRLLSLPTRQELQRSSPQKK